MPDGKVQKQLLDFITRVSNLASNKNIQNSNSSESLEGGKVKLTYAQPIRIKGLQIVRKGSMNLRRLVEQQNFFECLPVVPAELEVYCVIAVNGYNFIGWPTNVYELYFN